MEGKKKRTSNKEQREKSLGDILDAAEYLVSTRGLYGVTFRDVAAQIGVHSSLLGYYFDSKHELFEAVFVRHAEMHTKIRMDALDWYEVDAAGNYTVEGALHAFIDTDFNSYIEGGEQARNYGGFGAQVSTTPEWGSVTRLRRRRSVLGLPLRFCSDDAGYCSDRAHRSTIRRSVPIG